MKKNIFKGKTVLITGHTGFKGSWLSLWLSNLDANIVGISKDIPSNPSNFDASSVSGVVQDHFIDIRDSNAVRKIIKKVQPDFVFHLAAQALVRVSYENPLETMMANAIGSANILDALRFIDKKVVFIAKKHLDLFDALAFKDGIYYINEFNPDKIRFQCLRTGQIEEYEKEQAKKH